MEYHSKCISCETEFSARKWSKACMAGCECPICRAVGRIEDIEDEESPE